MELIKFNVLCEAADMIIGTHDANATDNSAVLHIHADLGHW